MCAYDRRNDDLSDELRCDDVSDMLTEVAYISLFFCMVHTYVVIITYVTECMCASVTFLCILICTAYL